MSEPSEQNELDRRAKDVLRRTQELEDDRTRLHDRLLEIAESVRRSHEQTAEMLDALADTGLAEHVTRRRHAAEEARRLAEQEARHIAELTGLDTAEQSQRDRPAAEPS